MDRRRNNNNNNKVKKVFDSRAGIGSEFLIFNLSHWLGDQMWIWARVAGVIDGVTSVMSHYYLLKAKRDARWLIKKLGERKFYQ